MAHNEDLFDGGLGTLGCRRGWSRGRPARVDLARLVSRVAKGVDLWERCGTSGRGLGRGDSRAQRGAAPGERAGRFGRARPPSQILVVDDHSTDVTASLAASHQLAQRGQLRVLTAEGTGKKSALLTGRASASTPWVVTLDADVRLGPSWAQAWHDRLHEVDANTACVAGPVVLSLSPQSPSLWEGVQALDYAAQMGWSAGCLVRDLPGSASGANMAVRVDTYPDTRNLGASGDDTLVVQALQRGGHHVEWLADSRATVRTAGATSLPGWIQQRMRWAGKAVHYDRSAKRTAWWMASMAVAQWALWMGACVASTSGMWGLAWGWWVLVTGMNLA